MKYRFAFISLVCSLINKVSLCEIPVIKMSSLISKVCKISAVVVFSSPSELYSRAGAVHSWMYKL